ncbi:hypothetical protein LZ30DRAFT_602800 [Colletotrichum cereale]|nr:hypothetical protein LZ30DRAFT_602800 [Colletotrichum cereale]
MDFGVAAGVAGFVSLLIQITSGINKLRDILKNAEQAPAELEQLLRELMFLQHLMDGAKGLSHDPALEHCEASCGLFVHGLERLIQKLPMDSEKGKGPNMVKTLLVFRHWKKDVEDLLRNIQAAKINLILLTSHRTSQCLGEMMLVNRLHQPPAPVSTSAITNDPAVPQILPIASSRQSPGSFISMTNSLGMVAPRARARARRSCLSRSCSCSCHRTERTSRRFWALEYTPPAVFRQTCDVPSCNAAKYGGTFRIALSQLGVRWAAAIQFYILAESGKFSMRPCFEMERIVSYTFPGFELIWRCKDGFIGFEEARNGLLELKRTDPTFPAHVNPDGKSHIEVIIQIQDPWWPEKQFELLQLFMQELKITKGTESPQFLPLCAGWVEYGYHMDLLETLLELGFDTTLADPQYWPEVSSPDWRAEKSTPDPFFVKYLSILCKDNQGKSHILHPHSCSKITVEFHILGFAGLSPLHEAVVFGPSESIRNLIPRSEVNERNILGQTPLYFAVSNPLHLEALLQSNPDLDAPDKCGITPLMYAAAENREESVMMLLDAGANLGAEERRYSRTFINYGALRRHWKLVLKCLSRINDLRGKQAAEAWARNATVLFHVKYPDRLEKRDVTLDQFLIKCGDVNFFYDNLQTGHLNRTLLHDASSTSDLDALLDNGFNLINHADSAGQYPLMTAAARGKVSLVEGLLNTGAKIGLKDNWHRTAIHHALANLSTGVASYTQAAMDTVCILVSHGADLLSRDNCRCPCSPEGCLPGVELKSSISDNWGAAPFPVWAMEWACLVYENEGIDGAKTAVGSLLRRTKHQEMGMTHVCCRRSPGLRWDSSCFSRSPSCIPDDDIDDILDEESEFIEILEKEMTRSTNQEYELLFDEWIRQIKLSLAVLSKEIKDSEKNSRDRHGDRRACKHLATPFKVLLLTKETVRPQSGLQE